MRHDLFKYVQQCSWESGRGPDGILLVIYVSNMPACPRSRCTPLVNASSHLHSANLWPGHLIISSLDMPTVTL